MTALLFATATVDTHYRIDVERDKLGVHVPQPPLQVERSQPSPATRSLGHRWLR